MYTDSQQAKGISKKLFRFPVLLSLVLVTLAVTGAIVVGCGNGLTAPVTSTATSSSTTSTTAKVSLKLSDPATCMAPSGPFAHVYITISDIKAHSNANAGDSDAGWVDLTPGLSAAPRQVDLLGLADNQCFLGTLGAAAELQPGNYQQIRVILSDNTTVVQGKSDGCASWANCVVLNDGSQYPLELSSEAKTGIKIPLGQIANGGFNVAAGQTKDLDIDFDTCASIVQEGDKYRLKPVLHAGEVSTTASSINGTVVDSATGNHIDGQVTVALEQKDATGVDRVFMSTLTDSSGQFVFCPLPLGTYDVVVVGQSAAGVVYSPTVVTGVSTGSSLSIVPLHALPVVSAGVATLHGTVTTQDSANPAAGTRAHLQLSTLEAVSSTLTVTVPLVPNASQSSVVSALATSSNLACPIGTDCVSYNLKVPAGPAFVGVFSAGGTTLTQSALPASYQVDGIASVPSSGGVLDCSPSELRSIAVTPVAGVASSVSTLAFVGCQ